MDEMEIMETAPQSAQGADSSPDKGSQGRIATASEPPRNDKRGRIATASVRTGFAMTAPAVLAPHQSGPCLDSLPPGGSLGETGERVQQLKRLSGILIDRLEEAVEGKDFSVKDIRTYTNTLMDLRQIQMTDPELIAREQELKLIKLRREAGELGPRQLRISFADGAEEASR